MPEACRPSRLSVLEHPADFHRQLLVMSARSRS
nr:MAG TPA: hypothetical protein [Caudoviricetes sp.]